MQVKPDQKDIVKWAVVHLWLKCVKEWQCPTFYCSADSTGKLRNPVRRSNSSPEMSASWKNPFLNRDKEKKDVKQERDGQTDLEGKTDGLSENKKPTKQTYSKDPR
jgi:hypothetical protein